MILQYWMPAKPQPAGRRTFSAYRPTDFLEGITVEVCSDMPPQEPPHTASAAASLPDFICSFKALRQALPSHGTSILGETVLSRFGRELDALSVICRRQRLQMKTSHLHLVWLRWILLSQRLFFLQTKGRGTSGRE